MDAARAIADLRELDRLTGGPRGARRVCWTDEWQAAREFLRERLAELPVEVSVDAAGNLWAELAGESEEVVAVGSHLDSVPNGGWLDGALGVMAALEVLRSAAARGRPARTLALVDWADEEGARFGRSLLGSSAFAGALDVESVRRLRDAEGIALPEALAAHGVDVDALARAGEGRRERLAAYVELHIEQGPVLEAEDVACAAVEGCFGVERYELAFAGATGHAGSTPMDRRADAAVAAARAAIGLQEVGRSHGGVCTVGRVDYEPGIVTAIAGRARLLVDQRHLDPGALAEMLTAARKVAAEAAATESCSVEEEPIWRIDPVPFAPALVAAARDAAGTGRTLPSGALHDAAAIAQITPAVMLFVPSAGGVSHAPEEDTPEADLTAGIEAFGRLADAIVTGS